LQLTRSLRAEALSALAAEARFVRRQRIAALLDRDVVLRTDPAAVQAGATRELCGAPAVADTFKGRAVAARPVLVNGPREPCGLRGGQPRVVVGFTIAGGKIVAIALLADPELLAQLDLAVLND